MSEEFVVEIVSGLRWGEPTVLGCEQQATYPVKNKLGRSAVVFCTCEIIQLFYVVFQGVF
jgi:hypothetical protein